MDRGYYEPSLRGKEETRSETSIWVTLLQERAVLTADICQYQVSAENIAKVTQKTLPESRLFLCINDVLVIVNTIQLPHM